MKIAIPSEDDSGLDSEVARHFGRAEYYTIIDLEDGKIKDVRVVKTPFREHNPGDIPVFLKEEGVEAVLAYGMGWRAQELFNSLGIKVVTGANGRIRDIVEAFARGSLIVDEKWREREEFKHHR